MYNEFTVQTAKNEYKVFLQAGFYTFHRVVPLLHQHHCAEVHLISGGSATFQIGEETKTLGGGTVLVIPKNILHGCLEIEEHTLHTAFQIDMEVDFFVAYAVSRDLASLFFEEIKQAASTGDYAGIALYIQLLLRPFSILSKQSAAPISDYQFLIYEFFTKRYAEDIHLSELAEMLHLSERQTERIVLQYTGKTFHENLTDTRISMAKRLLATTNMSATEVAQYVGYRSYAGFWKAMRKSQPSVQDSKMDPLCDTAE